MQVYRSLKPEINHWNGMIYTWAAFHWLAMSHTCYNPIILCWMNIKFRFGFYSIVYKIPFLRRIFQVLNFRESTFQSNTINSQVTSQCHLDTIPLQNIVVGNEILPTSCAYE